MGKGSSNRTGALLQGLLAIFTGGSLILFAVLAATTGLSTPGGESPSIAEDTSRSGGSVTVQGLGENERNRGTGSRIASGPPSNAPDITAPGSQSPAPAPAPTIATETPVDTSPVDTSPGDDGATVATTGGFGFQVPSTLTPGRPTAGPPPPAGAPIRPGAYVPTTGDELPDFFKKRFGAGNGLGASDVDKADRVTKRLGRRALRKVLEVLAKAEKKAKAVGKRGAGAHNKPARTKRSGKSKFERRTEKSTRTGTPNIGGSGKSKSKATGGGSSGRRTKGKKEAHRRGDKNADRNNESDRESRGDNSHGDRDDDDHGDRDDDDHGDRDDDDDHGDRDDDDDDGDSGRGNSGRGDHEGSDVDESGSIVDDDSDSDSESDDSDADSDDDAWDRDDEDDDSDDDDGSDDDKEAGDEGDKEAGDEGDKEAGDEGDKEAGDEGDNVEVGDDDGNG